MPTLPEPQHSRIQREILVTGDRVLRWSTWRPRTTDTAETVAERYFSTPAGRDLFGAVMKAQTSRPVTHWPGYREGAVVAGRSAAEDAARELT